MKTINLKPLTRPELLEPETPEVEYGRLIPENDLDKKAMAAFCASESDGALWISERVEGHKITVNVRALRFDDQGLAVAKQYVQPPEDKFDPRKLFDAPSVELLFWIAIDGNDNPRPMWRVTSSKGLSYCSESNLLPYPIVFEVENV